MKRKIMLFLLVCALLVSSIGVGVTAFAAGEEGESKLLFTDDCTSLASANVADKSANMMEKDESGLKMFARSTAEQGYVTFTAGGGIGSAELQLWASQGKADIDYAFATGTEIFGVYVSAEADSGFRKADYTYEADAENGSLVVVTVNNIPAGNSYIRITMEGNVVWNPGLVSISAYGKEEGLLFTDDCTSVPQYSHNVIVEAGENRGYKRGTQDAATIAYALGGTLESVSIEAWFDGFKMEDVAYAYATGLAVRAYGATEIPADLSSPDVSSLTEITLTYAEKNSESCVFSATGTAEAAAGFDVLIIRILGNNVLWTPQLLNVSVRGTEGGGSEEPEPPEEQPVFTDPCTDLIEVYSFDANIKNDARGITRADSEPGGIVYGVEENIGRIEAVLNVYGGYDAWTFDVDKQNYNIRLFVGQSADGPFAEVGYTASQKTAVGGDGWGQVAIVSDEITSEVKFVRLLLDAPGTSWFVCIRSVSLFAAEDDPAEIASVRITNDTLSFVSGGNLAITAETEPAGALVWFEVYDDEQLQTPSVYARFDGNVLSADFYDAQDKIVWVVAKSGSAVSEPVAVTISRRPDATDVVLTADKYSFAADDTVQLSVRVTPSNAIGTVAEYTAYLDETCSKTASGVLFEGSTLSVADEFRAEEFWVVASVRTAAGDPVESAPVRFTVIYKDVILSDTCTDLNKADADLSDINNFRIENNAVRKIFSDTLTGGGLDYAALGTGSARTDHQKYEVPSLVYTTPADVGSFALSLIVYDEGNGALQPANKDNYLGLVNVYVSADGKEWTYASVDFTASTDVGGSFASAYTKLNLFNAEDLPEGVRYFRIDFLGQVSKREIQSGGTYSYNPYQGGITKEEDYGDIVLFYNSYSPFLAGVTLYAESGAAVEPVLSALRGEEGMSLYAGETLKIGLYQEFANAPGVFTSLEDFSNVTYTVLEGADVVQLKDGTDELAVKDGYTGGTAVVRFRAAIGNVVSGDIEVRVFVPVTSVIVTAEKTQLSVGETLALSAAVAPSVASFPSVGWYITEGEGYISADGVFTATKEGTVKIIAVADGVESEAYVIEVTAAAQPAPGGEEPGGGCSGAAGIAASLAAAAVLTGTAALLLIRRKKNNRT